jgi:hypothetical protein
MTFLHKCVLVAGAAAFAAAIGVAAEAGFSARGPLVFKDDFSAPTLDKGWVGNLGTWEVANGAVKISELAANKHAAVRRHSMQYHDAIFEFSFQFNGAKMIGLSLNNQGGHVCRASITPKGMILQTDQPNKTSDIKTAKLATLDTPVDTGKWHKVVVEVHGRRMTGQLDGGKIISGESPRVDVGKADFGFAIAGVSASLKDVRVYEVRAQ